MNKMYSYLKEEYLNEAKNRKDGQYTAKMIFLLRDMAEHEVYPDGKFSDEECNVWSAFHLCRAVAS